MEYVSVVGRFGVLGVFSKVKCGGVVQEEGCWDVVC